MHFLETDRDMGTSLRYGAACEYICSIDPTNCRESIIIHHDDDDAYTSIFIDTLAHFAIKYSSVVTGKAGGNHAGSFYGEPEPKSIHIDERGFSVARNLETWAGIAYKINNIDYKLLQMLWLTWTIMI